MTERKRAEQELRASEERFRTLVQFSFDVYWESDAQHRFIRQEFAESVVDAPARGSELGKTRWEVPYLEPDAEAWRKHRETLDAHLPFRDFELARPMPDGGKRYVSVSGLPVFDENGRFTGYRGVGRHITERKQAEQALREAQTELAHVNRVTTMGQLTASIAHEVNQPIAAAVTNAYAALRWLRASPPDLEEVRQSLGQVIENGRRAGDVIDGIRALVKKAPPRSSRFDLNEAILDVIALTRSEVLKHGVALQTELATGLPSVDGDRVQLQQVILNLIMNAAEAMGDLGEERRELLISTRTDAAGGVLVAVRNSGRASTPQVRTAFSRPSTPPSPPVWGWVWRSAGRSSRRTVAGCGPVQISRGGQYFNLHCRRSRPRPFRRSRLTKRRTVDTRGQPQPKQANVRASTAASRQKRPVVDRTQRMSAFHSEAGIARQTSHIRNVPKSRHAKPTECRDPYQKKTALKRLFALWVEAKFQ